MNEQEIKLMLRIIENLDIFVSDDDTYEMESVYMPKVGFPNFEKDVKKLTTKLKGML